MRLSRISISPKNRFLTALPKLAKSVNSDRLRNAFETHHGETEGQVGRLEKSRTPRVIWSLRDLGAGGLLDGRRLAFVICAKSHLALRGPRPRR